MRLPGDFYDAALIDLNYTRDTTSGQEGLDLLSEIVNVDGNLPIIVMTAWGNVELAVEAMRRGARDFIQKPWENERLLAIVRTQTELHRALQRAERLAGKTASFRRRDVPNSLPRHLPCEPVLMPSPESARRTQTSLYRRARSGKEVVAQTLHALSSRASRPLVAVNTGACRKESLKARFSAM